MRSAKAPQRVGAFVRAVPWTRGVLCVVVLAMTPGAVFEARAAVGGGGQEQLVRVVDGALTVDVRDMPLRELLEEIARQAGLVIEYEASPDTRVTARLPRMGLDDGLHELLNGHSYALEYSASSRDRDAPRPVLTRVRIFRSDVDALASAEPGEPRDESIDWSRFAAVLFGWDDVDEEWDKWDVIEALGESEQEDAALPLLRVALADEDGDVRLAAVEALAALGGDGAAEALAPALRDQEGWIRTEAIEALAGIGGERAAETLLIALQAEDAELREQAVQALGEAGGPTARQLLEYAWASDTDDAVREAATAWLEEGLDQPGP